MLPQHCLFTTSTLLKHISTFLPRHNLYQTKRTSKNINSSFSAAIKTREEKYAENATRVLADKRFYIQFKEGLHTLYKIPNGNFIGLIFPPDEHEDAYYFRRFDKDTHEKIGEDTILKLLEKDDALLMPDGKIVYFKYHSQKNNHDVHIIDPVGAPKKVIVTNANNYYSNNIARSDTEFVSIVGDTLQFINIETANRKITALHDLLNEILDPGLGDAKLNLKTLGLDLFKLYNDKQQKMVCWVAKTADFYICTPDHKRGPFMLESRYSPTKFVLLDNNKLAISCRKDLIIFDMANNNIQKTIPLSIDEYNSYVGALPDGHLLIVNPSGALTIWDVEKNSLVRELASPLPPFKSVGYLIRPAGGEEEQPQRIFLVQSTTGATQILEFGKPIKTDQEEAQASASKKQKSSPLSVPPPAP